PKVNDMKRALIWAALVAAIVMSSGAVNAAQSAGAAKTIAGTLSPAQRGEMAHAFVTRWGNYVQRVYGLDVRVWANRMVGTFVHSDPTNFQRALQRSTYEGAMAELDGRGTKLSDTQVINTLATQSADVTPMS